MGKLFESSVCRLNTVVFFRMSESDDSWESDDSDGDIGTGLLFENFSSTILIRTSGFYRLRRIALSQRWVTI